MSHLRWDKEMIIFFRAFARIFSFFFFFRGDASKAGNSFSAMMANQTKTRPRRAFGKRLPKPMVMVNCTFLYCSVGIFSTWRQMANRRLPRETPPAGILVLASVGVYMGEAADLASSR